MRKSQKRKLARFIWSLLIILMVGVLTFVFRDDLFPPAPVTQPVSGDEVQFHFIDVGQADAALIRTAAGDILIDAGDSSSGDEIKAYLDGCGVSVIEYAIFTHPHEDHIGSADVVFENYEIKNVILPDKTHTSATYADLMDAIEAEGSEVIIAEPDKTFSVGELKCTILAPISNKYSNLNDYSVVLRADYGETSVLFTGDAEILSEDEMLSRYSRSGMLDCDLIKVGHHGSDSSSGKAFLDAVTPDFAVISCGTGNMYGHPVQSVLDRYASYKIPVYRTDLEGDIVFTSHGGEPEKKAA